MRRVAILPAGLALVAAHGFSFRTIEFEPEAARLPAAQAFVATVAAPGTPIADAVGAIEHAEAACRRPRTPAAPIVCRASRAVQRSDLSDQIGDVVWTVALHPRADGTVADAEVTRARYGL